MTLFSFSKQDSHHSSESNSELGLIPRICQTMFAKMQQSTDNSTTFRTEASYLEIYNEKVKDLLGPDANGTHGLKVRFFLYFNLAKLVKPQQVDINYKSAPIIIILFEGLTSIYGLIYSCIFKKKQSTK